MSKLKDKIWWLILIYMTVGYILPMILRQRFVLVILALTAGLIYLEKPTKEKGRLVAICTILALFFLKIIPSPYHFFEKIGSPMAIGLILTILVVFLSCVLFARISDVVVLRVKRAKE
jgi:hypothetical protein